MKIRFQADANLSQAVDLGVKRREPLIDYRGATGVIPDGLSDFDVLTLAAEDNRVLLTRDVSTIPEQFARFSCDRDSPGVILIPRGLVIREIIDGVLLSWLSWTDEELRNQIRWLVR